MSINMSNDKMIPKNIPTDMDAYDETVASQEEIYLEKTEEQLRAILISEDPSTYVQQETVCVDCCFVADSLDEELPNHPGETNG
jgi:acetone carboxylase gamma subunit